jgi:hypothetical protein
VNSLTSATALSWVTSSSGARPPKTKQQPGLLGRCGQRGWRRGCGKRRGRGHLNGRRGGGAGSREMEQQALASRSGRSSRCPATSHTLARNTGCRVAAEYRPNQAMALLSANGSILGILDLVHLWILTRSWTCIVAGSLKTSDALERIVFSDYQTLQST